MKSLAAFPDSNSMQSFPQPSSYIDNHVLAANVAESFTKPAGARFVRLSANTAYFFNPNAVAVVPSGDVTDGSGSIVGISTESRTFCVDGVTAISVISVGVCTISAEWFA